MRFLFLFVFFPLIIFASEPNFIDGKKVFDAKCIACHKEYIPINLVKENFFAKSNKLLNLKAPSVNMIVWAMNNGPKKIIDENELDFQEIQIENFLKSYLEIPDRFNSICDDNIIDYYDNKVSMKGQLSDNDYANLAKYFLEYKNNIKEDEILKDTKYSQKEQSNILEEANKKSKKIIVYATSSSCYFCKKMDKEVFANDVVKKILEEDYIFLEIDMDKFSLPFDLQKDYKRITPSFFIVNSDKNLITQYPGAWIKKDFIDILKEHKK